MPPAVLAGPDRVPAVLEVHVNIQLWTIFVFFDVYQHFHTLLSFYNAEFSVNRCFTWFYGISLKLNVPFNADLEMSNFITNRKGVNV